MALNTLRSTAQFDLLRDTLHKICHGKKVFYCPNPGNWGDALIHQGILQFLHTAGIAFQTVQRKHFNELRRGLSGIGMRLSGAVLLASGAGSWCETWPNARHFVERVGHLFDDVVVLPSTLDLPLIAEATQVTYFSRDTTERGDARSNVHFCHDMAFYVDLDIDLSAPAIATGSFFRTDRERHPDAWHGSDNVDLSRMGDGQSDIRPFLQLLAGFRTLRTDRLHVAIASCLLGRECTLYPGSYLKSRAVYEASIAPHFSNCVWSDW